MNIFEYMSFNVEWFLTVPGMLITGGVVLLLIALIVLLTSGKKSDDEVQNVVSSDSSMLNNDYNNFNQVQSNTVNVPMQNVSVPNSQVQTINSFDNNQVPVSDVNSMQFNQGVVPMQNQGGFSVETPTAPTQSFNSVDVPVSGPVLPNVEIPSVNTPVADQVLPSVEVPSVSTPVTDQVLPNVEIPSVGTNESITTNEVNSATSNLSNDIAMPVVDSNIPNVGVNAETEVQSSPFQQPSVSIYGGASPVSNVYPNEEPSKPVIYGGADPLENTGSIPKVDVAPVVPQMEAKIVEPVVQNSFTSIPTVQNFEQPLVDNSFEGVSLNQTVVNPQPSSEFINNSDNNISKSEIETLEF